MEFKLNSHFWLICGHITSVALPHSLLSWFLLIQLISLIFGAPSIKGIFISYVHPYALDSYYGEES